ncbi:MAG: hypothetical protein A3J62_00595 [Candidatus Buchananbacteria bacterium RIFCSPHIGHO2_02_FULL_38_8]|uniref:CYTH domain-containing protein n=2 Tax=Candidatus Buchananiibacteriota TaxID=1817903 RepID=A0A1G1Y2V8_9BACT|nr:MAG: hypothetical protein A2731_01110 [Candidatus Buchananbacteria bacterium RIFCSPHIGHO2_01_FULL_39_8]OGY47263.1 MAG: hypothetical protein A3J62_00595 [Candidatus Buchananbacteria bacterium RIFCSPHIGHO2_02_FULL_38_8]
MNIEIEVKARCSDLVKLKKSLKKIGARRIGKIHQVDTYFLLSPKHRYRWAPRLRIREHWPKGKSFLEYHEPINKFKAREFEVAVNDPKTVKLILKKLGYLREAIIDKVREKYTYQGLHIDVDQVKGLGKFIEVECMKNRKDSLKRIYNFYIKLGISPKDLIPEKRYLDMTWEK